MPKHPRHDPERKSQNATSSERKVKDAETRSSTYRGVPIEISGNSLRIAGRDIMVDVNEERVYSHEMAYRHFGSLDELAEALIRDWGFAKIEHEVPMPHKHGDDHD